MRTCLGFPILLKLKKKIESVTEKIIPDGKEMSENMNDTEIEYVSVKDPVNIHRSASNDTTLVSEVPNMVNEENVIIVPAQGIKQFQF